jgi:hypothetical protein
MRGPLFLFRARICKRLSGPGIDSKEAIPPDYMYPGGPAVRQLGLSYRSASGFLGSLKDLQILAQIS